MNLTKNQLSALFMQLFRAQTNEPNKYLSRSNNFALKGIRLFQSPSKVKVEEITNIPKQICHPDQGLPMQGGRYKRLIVFVHKNDEEIKIEAEDVDIKSNITIFELFKILKTKAPEDKKKEEEKTEETIEASTIKLDNGEEVTVQKTGPSNYIITDSNGNNIPKKSKLGQNAIKKFVLAAVG